MFGKRPHPDQEEQSAAKRHKADESNIPATASSSPRPSRRKQERSSDESLTSEGSHRAAPSIFSAVSAETEITVPGQGSPATKMATNPAADPAAFKSYYWGLCFSHSPKLLARSNTSPWTSPLMDHFFWHDMKKVFVVTHHPLREKLANGLRDRIRNVLAQLKIGTWISVNYLRIGYDGRVWKNNPVTVLVTVVKDQVSYAEAQWVVDNLVEECRRFDLHDVEVEVMEGERATKVSSGDDDDDSIKHEILPFPVDYPHIGAAIQVSSDDTGLYECGTLGGYVQVDGQVMGLTNNHVAVGTGRVEAYPTTDEKITGKSYTCYQPAEGDLDDLIKSVKSTREELRRIQEKQRDMNLTDGQIKSLDTNLEMLQSWTPAPKRALGKVWRSSGIRARDGPKYRRFRLDWALIKLDNPDRFSAGDKFANKIPDFSLHAETKDIRYFTRAMKRVGVERYRTDMPNHLRRGLTFEEHLNNGARAEESNNHHVVWKFGRTSHFTFGLSSYIESDYCSDSGVVSDELVVVDCPGTIDNPFSKSGDSGSLIWDSDGYVCGMLWGGIKNSIISFVTPIEYILEDIRQVCGAKEVKLLVRKEDETDVVFSPPERQLGAFAALESGIGPTDYSDDQIAEILAAEGSPTSGI